MSCLAAAVVLIAAATPARAADAAPRRVLVFDVVPEASPSPSPSPSPPTAAEASATAEALTAGVLAALRGRPEVAALGRGDMETLLRFQGLQQSLACDQDRCRQQLAESLDAQVWVTGTLRAAASAWLLSLTATDVASGRAAGTETATGFSPDELAARLGELVPRLLGLAAGSGAEAAAPAFVLAPSASGEPIKIAVVDLAAANLSPEDRAGLSELIAVVLRGYPDLAVISKDDIQRLLEFESQRQLVGCDDESCLAEIGGALGVQYLVAGMVANLGAATVVSLKLIDIHAATTDNRVAESFTGEQAQLLSATRHALLRLIGRGLDATGSLRVDSAERDLRLQLDGREVAAAALARVPVGRHSLRLESDDTYPWLGDVYVRDDQPVVVRAVLQERPTPWYRAWWFWSAAAAVVVGAGAATAAVLATQPSTGTLNIQAAPPLGSAP